MKAIPCIIGCILAWAVACARVVEDEDGLVLEMTVPEVAQVSGGGLRMVGVGSRSGDDWGVVVRVPSAKTRRWPTGARHYRFYVFLEPRDEGSREFLDGITTKKFPTEGRHSLFKPGGYEAVSPILPKKFGRAGGLFFLADPGIGPGTPCNVWVEYDPRKKTLVMRVREVRY